MSADSSFKILGLRELQQDLRRLAPEMEGRISRRAIKAGAAVIVAAARKNAPRRAAQWEGMKYKVPRGTLKRGIISVAGRGSRGQAVRMVGLRPTAWYGVQVEYGHALMRPRGKTFGPGRVAPRPFLRPAFDENVAAAIEIIKKQYGVELEAVRLSILQVR